VTVSQSTDAATTAAAATAESAASLDRPRPVTTSRPTHECHCPARFLETVQVRRLTYRNSAARACYRSAGGDVSVTSTSYSQLECRVVSAHTTKHCSVDCDPLLSVESLQSCGKMPRSRKFCCEAEWADSVSSDATPTATEVADPDVGAPTIEPLAFSPGPAGGDTGHQTPCPTWGCNW